MGVLHAFPPALAAYAAMRLAPRRAGVLAWGAAFPYLVAAHVRHSSALAWKEGQLDFTGALMVLTLKVISVAVCTADGAAPPDKAARLTPYAAAKRLPRAPSLLEYFSYLFCAGNLLAGPAFEMRDYLDYIHRRGAWDESDPTKAPPSAAAAGAARVAKALALAAAWIALLKYGYTAALLEGEWWLNEVGAAKRVFLLWAVVVVFRLKYYAVWGLAEAALVLNGMGWEGWGTGTSEDEGESGEAADALLADGAPAAAAGGLGNKRTARWGRYCNARVLRVEANPSLADTPRHWNVLTGAWLRHYVYERLPPGRRGRPGFAALLATQLVSGVWHGIFAGYWLFFASTAFAFEASKALFRYERALCPAVRGFPPWVAAKAVLTALVLNYAGAAFLVLDFHSAVAAWRAVGWFGHVITFAVLALERLAPPRRAPRVAPAAAAEPVRAAADEPAAAKKEL